MGVLINSYSSIAQEDVASREEMLVEQQNINFQTFFFEALQQKAIGNFDKAIYALEACNNIDKDNVAVLFELSKNYSLLFNNCEHFATHCVIGAKKSRQLRRVVSGIVGAVVTITATIFAVRRNK